METVAVAVVSDFDETIAQTFTSPPDGLGVREATWAAITQMFGQGGGEAVYYSRKDLAKLAPSEVVQIAIQSGDKDDMIGRGRAYHLSQNGSLAGYVPAGLGQPLEWRDGDELLVLTEVFVRTKLRYLMDQIGQPLPGGGVWPTPCDGFLEFWMELQRLQREEEMPINFGIVSSGHNLFIEKTFRAWGLEPPKLMVTDDLMRSLRFAHLPPKKRVKPSPVPLQAMCELWLTENGLSSDDPLGFCRNRVVFVGDSIESDGGMARNAGIEFIWFNGNKKPSPDHRICRVDSWTRLLTLPQYLIRGAAVTLPSLVR